MAMRLKYAILDTDFVSKANIIRAGDETLADEVLAFPEYRFFCHQKMKEELSDHGTRSAKEWLDRMIKEEKIVCYSDEQIIQELKNRVSDYCFLYYQSFLKKGCDLFDTSFYENYFAPIDEFIQSGSKDMVSFLSVIKSCEAYIGHQQSYGEMKALYYHRHLNCSVMRKHTFSALMILAPDRDLRMEHRFHVSVSLAYS